jgi:hypothetical protein
LKDSLVVQLTEDGSVDNVGVRESNLDRMFIVLNVGDLDWQLFVGKHDIAV